MADNPTVVLLPSIAALPPTTARQIGSGQVLVDTSSVVKELIDNALDARANTIFVNITANTIDSIQVKDDGHGILAEDRALVCRRYCTSKIRDFHDLKQVGGRWLGFRGEALSSVAELSGTLSVTTRVEGEPVAVKLKYGRDGELASTERNSHPVGTTVKATHFFEIIPVRKQTALQNSAKCLAKIRRLLQAYALARPSVRFRLRVLKARNNKGDFIYAPNASSNVADAVLKVIGKDCALQCDWTALESDGFEIHAFLPKPTANGPKIANQGAFISVDSRPVSNTRGTIKQVVNALKRRLRKTNPSLATVKDPFFCMNIICPPDSYDPNIEPAKDDVMFDNGDTLLSAVDKMMRSYYPEAIIDSADNTPPTSAQQPEIFGEDEDVPTQNQTPVLVYEEPPNSVDEEPTTEPRSDQPRWRSSMYGIDEEDMEFLQENQPPILEEEEGSRAITVSNPWTIARMNATIKPRIAITNGQLLSPAKSRDEGFLQPSSPAALLTPRRKSLVEPLTPQMSSRTNVARFSLDDELEQSIRRLPQHSHEEYPVMDLHNESLIPHDHQKHSVALAEADSAFSNSSNPQHPGGSPMVAPKRASMPSQSIQAPNAQSYTLPTASPSPRRSQRKQRSHFDMSVSSSAQGPSDTWFGQPMRGSEPTQPPRRQNRCKNQEAALFASDVPSSPQKQVSTAAERLIEHRLYSENKTDIRNFFGQKKRNRTGDAGYSLSGPSFTPITPPSCSSEPRSQMSLATEGENRSFPHSSRSEISFGNNSRASSAEPHLVSKHVRNQLLLQPDTGTGFQSKSMTDQLRAYEERERPFSQPSRATSFELPLRSKNVRDALNMHGDNGSGTYPRYIGSQFQAYEDVYTQSPMRRSSSAGSERPSLAPKRSNEAMAALKLCRHDRPSNNACDMAAHLRAYQDRENVSPGRTAGPVCRQEPRFAPTRELAGNCSPKRRRTTDGAQRTKSFKLPLERVPHGYHVQNIMLPIYMSLASIVCSSRKLDMSCNILKWVYCAEEVYDTFAEPISERTIMNLVIKLDDILHERCERMPSVDTRSLLHEGIQKGLDARKEDQATENVEIVKVPGPDMGEDKGKDVDDNVPEVPQHTQLVSTKAEDEMSDFHISQFVDFDVGKLDDKASATSAFTKAENEFDEDIEDDMLMDL